MGKPVRVNTRTSLAEYIGQRGERGELKHLSNLRKRKQAVKRHFQSSGERNGISPNRVYVKARKRCMLGVVGSDLAVFRNRRGVTKLIYNRSSWEGAPKKVKAL